MSKKIKKNENKEVSYENFNSYFMGASTSQIQQQLEEEKKILIEMNLGNCKTLAEALF